MAEKYTEQELELMKLYAEADEVGRAFMFDLLTCFVACGKPFIEEMQTYLNAKDKEAIFACVKRWKATLGEGATV